MKSKRVNLRPKPWGINVWPGGSKELYCLKCERKFVSRSKVERMCGRCRGDNGDDAERARARRAEWVEKND